MTPPWGINWLRYHGDGTDMPHIERMGYRSFTIYEWMWNNRDFCNELLSVARDDAIFLDRDHPLSEQKDDLWKSNPAQKGRNHADEWAQKVREGKVFTPLDRTYFLGLNEPDSNQYQRQIDAYNEAYCRRMAEHGLRAAAYSFGVGHPSTVDLKPDTPPDWSWYDASAAAILEGHHIAAFHEYGGPNGYGWEYWCNRVAFCPHPFNAVWDECGIDNGVLQSGVLKGYAVFMSPEQYVRQWLDGFQGGMAQRAHTRKVKILGYNLFCYDHGSGKDKDWHSFDIRPCRPYLESQQWSIATPTTNPDDNNTVHIPTVGTGTQPHPQIPYGSPIVTTVHANLREWSSLQAPVIRVVPPGTVFDMVGYNEDWYQVPRGDGEGDGWLHQSVVAKAQPTPAPVPTPGPVGDKWERAIAWVLKWEGGYQNVANDKGNWTGCEVGKGENKGTNYGISACSYPDLDIRALTLDEARAIYQRDYWQASGASTLDYPLCLLVLDTAVLHGVGTAKKWLAETGADPYAFAAKRLRTYTKLANWDFWGKAWVNRTADLLEEMTA